MIRRNLLLIASLVIAAGGCSAAQQQHGAASPDAKPSPLRACETRELALDGVDLVVSSNADGSLASVDVVTAPDAGAHAKALADAHRAFGPLRRDIRLVSHPSKWGLTTFTDPCGRPVSPVGR